MEEIDTSGATVSTAKENGGEEPVLPARSVCEAVMYLLLPCPMNERLASVSE